MRKIKNFNKAIILFFFIVFLSGCDDNEEKNVNFSKVSPEFSPISIEHSLGRTVIDHVPLRVAALDMNEVDLLDKLNVPVAGMPKDFVPNYLSNYSKDTNISDLGAIVQPNLEKVYLLKPDLILMTPLQASHYSELAKLAPTILFDVDYKDSGIDHFERVKKHLELLGKIFGREELANQINSEFNEKIERAKAFIAERTEKAMIVIHNNGSYSFLGEKSRYGFIFEALGVKPVHSSDKVGLHGQPISSEFILENNPDIIYIIDRTSVMEGQNTLNRESMINPVIRKTNAWKQDRVIFVNAEAWYITGSGITALNILIDDVLKGYREE